MSDLTPEEKLKKLDAAQSSMKRLMGYGASFSAIGFAWFFLGKMSAQINSLPVFIATLVVVTALVWLLTSPLRQ